MGANTRHYKALMKKNFINWKRTPCGSICEILCPIILMFILWYARTKSNATQFSDSSDNRYSPTLFTNFHKRCIQD